jgi:hypothetical protein
MSLPTPHYYCVKHPPGHVMSITVNDIPFYRRHSDCHAAPTGLFNHWMLEGENQLSLVIVQSEPEPGRFFKLAFEITRKLDDSLLLELLLSKILAEQPADERGLPLHYKTTFHYDEVCPTPVWLDAPRTDFPVEGTKEQHAAVAELWEAQRRKDPDEFLRVCEIKAQELMRFYGPQPATDPATAKAQLAPVMAEPWDLAPLEPHELMFERRGDGRTAYVSRKDGRAALFAKHRTDPGRTWEANLHLTLVAGQWRIFA